MTNPAPWNHHHTRVETQRVEWFTLPADTTERCRYRGQEYQPTEFGLTFQQWDEDAQWYVRVLIRGRMIRKSDGAPGAQQVRDEYPHGFTRIELDPGAGPVPELPAFVLPAIAAYWPDNPAPAPAPEPIGYGCGRPARYRIEGYRARDGRMHGSLDVALYACAVHLEDARTVWMPRHEMLSHLSPFTCTGPDSAKDTRCGEVTDYRKYDREPEPPAGD